MNQYHIRAELHGATWSRDYLEFHKKLAAMQMYPTVVAADKKVYLLPPATYTGFTELTLEQVLRDITSAANGLGHICSLFGTIITSNFWRSVGLKEVP